MNHFFFLEYNLWSSTFPDFPICNWYFSSVLLQNYGHYEFWLLLYPHFLTKFMFYRRPSISVMDDFVKKINCRKKREGWTWAGALTVAVNFPHRPLYQPDLFLNLFLLKYSWFTHVVLISAVQQSDSVIHLYLLFHTLPWWFITGYWI